MKTGCESNRYPLQWLVVIGKEAGIGCPCSQAPHRHMLKGGLRVRTALKGSVRPCPPRTGNQMHCQSF